MDEFEAQELWKLEDGDAKTQLDRILAGAIEIGASDIHIDVDSRNGGMVSVLRFRVDGQCRDVLVDPRKSLYEGVVSRLKTLSHCRLDESRVPQDGRVSFVHRQKTYEFRISFNPVMTNNEQLEKVVLRQMADVSRCHLDQLELHPYVRPFFQEAIALPFGFNVVTGPTGSGKTTTLYSVLQSVDRKGLNVCSIEEPIEAEVERVNQTQVRHDIGLDFARVLRALLRQDPDVIMVGEMRDLETAETALDAALTGHVVWSTLHTNGAVASVARLIQMGIKDYMVAHALSFVFAQRLARRLCVECSEPLANVDQFLEESVFPSLESASESVKSVFYKNIQNVQLKQNNQLKKSECLHCDGVGFKGRIGVLEVLKMTDPLRDLVLHSPGDASALQRVAIEEGMMTMEQYGLLKVLEGKTTLEEIRKVVR